MQSFLMLPLAVFFALSPLGACDLQPCHSLREEASKVIETMETERLAKGKRWCEYKSW